MDMRVVSYNIHKGVGWINTKPTISRIADQLSHINPQIVLIQEIRHHQFELLATKIWSHFHYAVNVITKKGTYGNAIFSTFPLKHLHNLDLTINRFEKRGMIHVVIDDKVFDKHVHVLCAHLGLFVNERKHQIKSIIKYIKHHIPNDELIILGGDFNDWNNQAIDHLIKEVDLIEAYMNRHKHYARTFPSWAPVLKLDRIFLKGFNVISAQRLLKKPWRYLSDHIALETHIKVK